MKDERTIFTVTTPEHVPLRLPLAEPGTRLAACGTDFLIILLATFLLFYMAALVGRPARDEAMAFAWTVSFLIRTFYFMAGEAWGRGQTFGKKWTGLRVIAADGGPLTTEMVAARNLTREFELFLPIIVMTAPEEVMPEAPPWVHWALAFWIVGIGILPLLTRRRTRLGDLLAGTVVVVEPRDELLLDLADSGEVEPDYRFTREQLDIYGIKELQVLEDVLRRSDSMARDELLRQILDRVVAKIEWPDPVPYTDAEKFLQAFYTAQRGRLEGQMLMGKRREHKVR